MSLMDATYLTREEVRSVDQRAMEKFGLSGIALMENAGRGAADLLIEQGINGPVVICCGKGNNGGDGFVIARHLEASGYDAQVLLFAKPGSLSGDAEENYCILEKAGTPVMIVENVDQQLSDFERRLTDADWIVDALLGTGIQGEVRSPFDSIIDAINAAEKKVFAVDLPSGLDCDTGESLGSCVKATLTGTFVAKKKGFTNPASQQFTGEVHVLPIGVPKRLLEQTL